MTKTMRRVDAGPAGGFDVHTFDSGRPGLRVAVLGGVHGDETEGAMAASRIAAAELEILAGRLDVIPICHEAAFAADSRTSPVDGKNLARVFPGDPGGTATPLLAHHIYMEVLRHADFVMDLHTSGQAYDMPFLAGYGATEPGTGSIAERAAIAFGADFVWRHPGRSEGRTLSVVPQGMYVESPGAGPTNVDMVQRYVDGVLRALAELGLLADAPRTGVETPIRVVGGGDLDRDMVSVGHDGIFLADVARGDWVEEGQLLGRVIDPVGNVLEEHRATATGYVMALKRRSPVRAGDLIVNLAEVDQIG